MLLVLLLGFQACSVVPNPPSATPTARGNACRPKIAEPQTGVAAQPLAGRLVFASGEPWNIWMMQVATMERRQLTQIAGDVFDPDFSPDGTRIVFRDSRHGINDDDEIYVMNADGSSQRNLTRNPANDWSPAWSPDGTRIAFTSDRGGSTVRVYVMRADGSDVRQLTQIEGEYPTWSPDGARIAFASSSTGSYQIWAMNADGSGQRQLTHGAHYNMYPAWSPDGSAILYDTQRDFATLTDEGVGPEFEIHVMNADGSCDTRLTNNHVEDRFPAWSPDGRHIVWTQQGQIAAMNADGSGQRILGAGSFPDWHA
jgi:TolB protein